MKQSSDNNKNFFLTSLIQKIKIKKTRQVEEMFAFLCFVFFLKTYLENSLSSFSLREKKG
jgi:hypothetical protein